MMSLAFLPGGAEEAEDLEAGADRRSLWGQDDWPGQALNLL